MLRRTTGAIPQDHSPWWGENYISDPHATPWQWGVSTNGTIQEGIDVASDTVQDTINVADGTYTIANKITVDKQGLTITGNTAYPENVVVQYNPAANSLIFDMRASNVKVEGIKTTNGKSGFWFDQSGVTGCTISHCIIDTVNEYGIYMKNGGSGHTIEHNTISYTGQTYAGAPAVLIENSLNIKVDSNTLSSISDKGIYVRVCAASSVAERVEVTNNIISGCAYPCIQVYQSPYTIIDGNTISSTSDKGINIIGPNANSVAERVEVTNNIISECPWSAILVTHDKYTYIHGNTIGPTGDKGISIANGENINNAGERIEVSGNTITRTKWPGIQVAYEVPYTYIYDNILTECNYYGGDGTGDWDYASIHVDKNCPNTIIDNNTVSDGINGIQIWSDNCTVTNNTIYNMGLTYADTKGTGDGTYYNSGIIIGSNWLTNNLKPTGTTITGNSIYDNYHGLYVRDYATLSPDDNSVLSVTAEENWWGSATGPTHTSNSTDTGDAVSDNVDYSPWWGANYVGDSHTNPWIWYVNSSNDSTIQEGVNAAITADTVKISSESYTGAVDIDKDLTAQLLGDVTSTGSFTNTSGTLDINNTTLSVNGNFTNLAIVNTSTGNIDIIADAITPGTMNAGLGNVTLETTVGGIAGGTKAIAGNILSLTSTGAIGTSDAKLNTTAGTINATANGAIYITEEDGATLSSIDSSVGNGTIDISSTIANLLIGTIDSGSGDINLTANSGSLLDSTSLIEGGIISLTATAGAIGSNDAYLNIAKNTKVNATSTGAGNDIFLNRTSGDIALGTISSNDDVTVKTTTTGDIIDNSSDITADLLTFTLAGAIGADGSPINTTTTMLSATASDGDIYIAESDDVALNLLSALSNYINVIAGGEITDNNGGTNNIIATSLLLDSATGLGSGDALETEVSNLAAGVTDTSATGNIKISNTGNLTLKDLASCGYAVKNFGSGSIDISAASTLTIASPVYASGGGINLSASENIEAGIITTSGNISLNALGGSITDADGNSNISGGNVFISAQDNIGLDGPLNISTTGSLTTEISNSGGYVFIPGHVARFPSIGVSTKGNLEFAMPPAYLLEQYQMNSSLVGGPVFFYHPLAEIGMYQALASDEDMYRFIDGRLEVADPALLPFLP
jgi:parallel beta-helix repeat protein